MPASIARFTEIEGADFLVEIDTGRRRHAGGTRTKIDIIEVPCEDLVLAELKLQPEGDDGFLDLPLPSPVPLQIENLDQLLGDGAAALNHLAGAKVSIERSSNAHQIDARMLVEAAILSNQYRLNQVGWKILFLRVRPLNRSLSNKRLAVGRFQNHHGLQGAFGDFVPRHVA